MFWNIRMLSLGFLVNTCHHESIDSFLALKNLDNTSKSFKEALADTRTRVKKARYIQHRWPSIYSKDNSS